MPSMQQRDSFYCPSSCKCASRNSIANSRKDSNSVTHFTARAVENASQATASETIETLEVILNYCKSLEVGESNHGHDIRSLLLTVSCYCTLVFVLAQQQQQRKNNTASAI